MQFCARISSHVLAKLKWMQYVPRDSSYVTAMLAWKEDCNGLFVVCQKVKSAVFGNKLQVSFIIL